MPPPCFIPMQLKAPAMRCSICCRRAAVLAATHAAHDHSYCNLAPAPAGGSIQQPLTHDRRRHAQPRQTKDPYCSIEAVGEYFPKKRICKVVFIVFWCVRPSYQLVSACPVSRTLNGRIAVHGLSTLPHISRINLSHALSSYRGTQLVARAHRSPHTHC